MVGTKKEKKTRQKLLAKLIVLDCGKIYDRSKKKKEKKKLFE